MKIKLNASKIIAVLVIIIGITIPATAYISISSASVGHNYSKKVLAFYYNWYGNTTVYDSENPSVADQWLHWNENDHNPPTDLAANQTPVLGPFDSANNVTIQQHLDWARYAGIDGFICTWWGLDSYDNSKYAKVLQYTMDNHINFTWSVYFESVQQRYQNNASEIARQIEYVCDTYGNLSVFLKEDNRPVIFCYAVGYEGTAVWQNATQQLHNAGYYPFLIGDMGGLGYPDPKWFNIFDGIHIYNPAGVLHNGGDYVSGYNQMIFAGQLAGRLTCYTVCPGYDDFAVCCVAPGERTSYFEVKRDNGNLYSSMWQNALNSNANWILICTFNEWHEGSEIEPSIQFGTTYINITHQYAPLWK